MKKGNILLIPNLSIYLHFKINTIEDATPVELKELDRELKLRGARLRHLRIINAAVLDRRFKQELDNEITPTSGGTNDNKEHNQIIDKMKQINNEEEEEEEALKCSVMLENKLKMYDVVKQADSFFQVRYV